MQTAAQVAKSYGLKSLGQAAELLNVTTETLRNWHKSEPRRFDIAMLGCSVYLAKMPRTSV